MDWAVCVLGLRDIPCLGTAVGMSLQLEEVVVSYTAPGCGAVVAIPAASLPACIEFFKEKDT